MIVGDYHGVGGGDLCCETLQYGLLHKEDRADRMCPTFAIVKAPKDHQKL